MTLQCALFLSLSPAVFASGKKHIPGGGAAALRYLYYAIIFYSDN